MAELYGEHFYEGGLLRFDGVTLDGKALKKVTVDKSDENARWAKAEYADGYFYKVTAKHTAEGAVETLEEIVEEWGKVKNEHS